MESVEELQATEAECIRRFRAKAAEIMRQHPELSMQIAYARAVQALPRTADKYSGARQLLQWRGIPAAKLY